VKKCHLAPQLCLLAEGCPVGMHANTWQELRRQNAEALTCGDRGPKIPLHLAGMAVGPELIRQIAHGPAQGRLLKRWESATKRAEGR